MLQARQNGARFAFIESAKLVKGSGEPLRALQELENALKSAGVIGEDVIDLTTDQDDEASKKSIAKVSRECDKSLGLYAELVRL